MIIAFRKARGFHRFHDVFQWRPLNGRRWYNVNRRNIRHTKDRDAVRYVRDLFNAILHGLTARIHAKYDRKTHVLTLDVMRED